MVSSETPSDISRTLGFDIASMNFKCSLRYVAEYDTASLAVIDPSVATSTFKISIGSLAPGTGWTLKVTLVTGLNILSIAIVPKGAFGSSFSSDGV